jgi:hypothetical protein
MCDALAELQLPRQLHAWSSFEARTDLEQAQFIHPERTIENCMNLMIFLGLLFVGGGLSVTCSLAFIVNAIF